ncbi:MAG: glycosyl transferase [Bacteroidetes bacterium]|nr:MAG: glycosyl transferase [Bacteroidota bacterium]
MSKNLDQFLIAIVAIILFLPFQTIHLFDWDEINFAEAAREMLVTGDYLRIVIDYQPFWEKPPLFIWLQAISMSLFGVNEFAARLPNLVCGVATLLVLYNVGNKLFNRNFGLIWVMAYAGCFLPQLYFMSGIIDPVFNLFIFLAIYYLHKSFMHGLVAKWVSVSGLFIGLAILTKGPVALLIYGLTAIVLYMIKKDKVGTSFSQVIRQGFIFISVVVTVSFLYYGVELIKNGTWFFEEFFNYQIRLLSSGEASHGQPFYYHFVVLLLGCLPASIIMLGAFKRFSNDDENQRAFKQLMIILLIVVLLIFSSVTTKIVHYSSLCYFPITFLAAYYLYQVSFKRAAWSKVISVMVLVFTTIFSLGLMALAVVIMQKDNIAELVQDQFAAANFAADVSVTVFDLIPGLIYLLSAVVGIYLITKQRSRVGIPIMFLGICLAINLSYKTFVPKIELITQRAAIEFYEELQGVDCYVQVLGFKSYAHLFYTKKTIVTNENSRDKEWLLTGDIDKPVYFVCKNVDVDLYRGKYPIEELGSKNGFVFFRRLPN